MKQYLNLIQKVLKKGQWKEDRTGTGTLSIFGHQSRYDLNKGFPLVTTKKLHMKSIIHELLWFLSGDSNIQYLNQNGVKIWNDWADEKGNLGPIYGVQWRKWKNSSGEKLDQISNVIDQMKKNPNSRRHIVISYNPGEIQKMALPPCHMFFQFYIAKGNLSCQMYQRSADIFLGVPFNIASYSLLTHMMAQVLNLNVGEFIHTLGDAHLYKNHIEQAQLQLARKPRKLPSLKLNPKVKSIFDFSYEDFEIQNYNPHPHIKAEISV